MDYRALFVLISKEAKLLKIDPEAHISSLSIFSALPAQPLYKFDRSFDELVPPHVQRP